MNINFYNDDDGELGAILNINPSDIQSTVSPLFPTILDLPLSRYEISLEALRIVCVPSTYLDNTIFISLLFTDHNNILVSDNIYRLETSNDNLNFIELL